MKTNFRIFAVCCIFAVCQATAFAQENVVAIVNAIIIDGNGGAPIEDGVILIRGDRIEAVGEKIKIPADAKIIDADGRVAMPGLADMHVHLGAGWSEDGRDDVLGYQSRLNALVYAGVTTVFDTGNFLPFVAQLRQEIDAGRIVGPKIYYVGPLIDSADPYWPAISRSLTSTTQAPGIVKYLKNNGADAVKAYGGLSGPQIRSLVFAARKESLPVIVDVWVRNGAEHLLTSGLRAFAHTPGRVTEDTINTMKEREIFIITTHAGTEASSRLRHPSYLQHPLIADAINSRILDDLRNEATLELTDREKENLEYKSAFIEQVQENVKKLWDAGVPLVAGTDGTTKGLFLGEGIHRELELLVAAGLTPLDAITAATKNAARLMDDEGEWGTLDAGKRADILLVKGRPDLNISDTRNVEFVIQRGRVIDRDALTFVVNDDPGFVDVTPTRSH